MIVRFFFGLLLGVMAQPVLAQEFQPSIYAETRTISKSDRKLAWAFKNRVSEFQAKCEGVVIRKLADDESGIRHQKFVVKLDSGQTILIVHNIDLAKRVRGLRVGNRVYAYGEYVWNGQGGLIHRTHDDPAGILSDGWIKHQGKVYR